jgi:hypothetical protein
MSLFEGRLTVPKDAIPKGGAFLWLSIGGKAYAGVAMDVDPLKAGDQPDTRHFVMLGMDEYFLATLSVETKYFLFKQIAGGESSDTRVQYRPFEATMRLVPVDTPFRAHTPESLLKDWLRLEEELHLERRRLLQRIAQRETELEVNERITKTLPPDLRGESKRELATLRRPVSEWKARVAEIETILAKANDIRPDFRALVRLLRAARVFQFDGDKSGPISGRFAGADFFLENVHKVGKDTIQGTARSWQTNNLESLGWRHFDFAPTLFVWRFNPEDLERVKVLLIQPAGWAKGTPARFQQFFENVLKEVVRIAWWFAQYQEGGVQFVYPSLDVTFPGGGSPRLPLVLGTKQFRMEWLPKAWPFPVSFSGTYTKIRPASRVKRRIVPITGENRRPQGTDLSPWFETRTPDPWLYHDTVLLLPHFVLTGEREHGLEKDIYWYLDKYSGQQVATWAHERSAHRYNKRDLIVTGAYNTQIFGDLRGRWVKEHGAVNWKEIHHARYHWHLVPNGMARRGRGHPWPGGPEVAQAEPEGSPEESGLDEPEGPPGGEKPMEPEPEYKADKGDGKPATPGGDGEDSPADGGDKTGGDQGDGEPVPPWRPEDKPIRFRPSLVTLANAGTLLGTLISEPDLERGRAVVYLDGPGLPLARATAITVLLNDRGFDASLQTVPAGGSVKFRNETGAETRLFSRSRRRSLDVRIPSGEEREVDFPYTGAVTILDHRARRMKLVVAPSPFTQALNAHVQAYVFRNVPPGTHLLRVLPENRRLRPAAVEVTVAPRRGTIQDVKLEPWRATVPAESAHPSPPVTEAKAPESKESPKFPARPSPSMTETTTPTKGINLREELERLRRLKRRLDAGEQFRLFVRRYRLEDGSTMDRLESGREPEFSDPSRTFVKTTRMLSRSSGIASLKEEIARAEKALGEAK